MTETTVKLMEQLQILIVALTLELRTTYDDVDVTLKVTASGGDVVER